jgi:hypothetical protein
MTRRTIKVGDKVRWEFLGRIGDTGTVLRVTPRKHAGGGVLASVRVRWDSSGYVGLVDDRVLVVVSTET